MATSNRASLIAATHKVLKKHFKPISPVPERPVLEQLLYACCLENAKYEKADECFARLQESFFDWNEVRVTTVRELSEILRDLPDPVQAATNLKYTLHSIFESQYAFDLDPLKKQNLGAAVKQLEGYRGVTPFMVAYVVQNSLGGHAIPTGKGALDVMYIVGAINESELEKGSVPGLERAVPKSQGGEFASLLHQMAAELVASPFNNTVRSILLEISPDAKERLPKRGARKTAEPPADTPAESVGGSKKSAAKKTASASKKAASSKSGPKKKKGAVTKKATKASKKSTSKQLARRKPR